MTVTFTRLDTIAVVSIDRPNNRNAVDPPTARQLADAFRNFDADASTSPHRQ